MVGLGQSYSFSPEDEHPPSSQWAQNSISNPESGLRKVTIRQLLDAIETNYSLPRFKINGFGVGKFMLVANVYMTEPIRAIPRQMKYGFDDGSGRIQGYKWEALGDPIFELFDYASIVGELDRYGNGPKSIKVFHIRPVYHAHEVYYHLLNAIVDTSTYEKGPPPPGSMRPMSLPSNDTGQLEHLTTAVQRISLSDEDEDEMDTPYSFKRMRSSMAGHHSSGLSRLERDIIQWISRATSRTNAGDGVNIGIIIEKIQSHYSDVEASDVSNAIEFLLTRNIIYTTIDDAHYACT